MKIQKIEKLDHARYMNFNWNSSVPVFSDSINILFGWNGSGKTTLSKCFHKIETGTKLESCTFKIKTDSKSFSETDSLAELKSNIRVFNEDYIKSTLTGDSKIPYIFFAGKEAVDYSQEEAKLTEKKTELSKTLLPTNHDQISKNTALLIKSVTGINSYKKELTGGGTYSSYDKTDFEKRFKNIQEKIKSKEVPDSSALIRPDIDALKTQLVNSDRITKNSKDISNAAQWLIDNTSNIDLLLESTPVQELSKRIEGLAETEVAWVKQGVLLHFSQDEKHEKCIFCKSDIVNTDELLKHFSDEVVRTINGVDSFIKQIENYTINLAKLESPTTAQTSNANKLRGMFDTIVAVLREKRNSVSSKNEFLKIDISGLKPLTTITESDATSIAYAIEAHFVAEQFQQYDLAYSELNATTDKIAALQKEITTLDEQVRALKQKARNTHESATALNTLFKVVFPYRKIEITDNDEGTGYILKRDETLCSFESLSEGEKNFIALAYFIYSINDAQNKLDNDGIVMIDDPVSSLDKQAIFQIFSIIVNEIKRNQSRQYFLFTHNLDFLGHLKVHFGKAIKQGRTRLMSLSATNSGCIIGEMDSLLKDHRSDYYYVFSVLYKFKDTCSLEDSYLVVNLLRRWLETFLEFKFSASGDLQSTLESAYSIANKLTEKWTTPFNASHLEMYRFINHGSHGFPDTESTDESILTNANVRIQEALQMVKILDDLHYKKLESLS
jgi:wobble nucleotide-excising tRNase